MIAGTVTGLRAVERTDLPLLKNWRNNESMRRFYREYRELNLPMQEAWFDSLQRPGCPHLMFVIENIDSGEALGVCGLTNINWVNRSAELSFYIGYKDLYVDETFAPDTLGALCNYAFSCLNMHKVWAEIYAFDERKKHILGTIFRFHMDGRLRDNAFVDGTYHDSLVFSLMREEFFNFYTNKP